MKIDSVCHHCGKLLCRDHRRELPDDAFSGPVVSTPSDHRAGDAAPMNRDGPITVTVLPAPAAAVDVDTDLRLELANLGPVTCRTVVVEFTVRGPLLLVHGDRRIELDRLGPGERHRHPIRLRATEAGAGAVVLRTFSYQDVLGHTVDAGGTTLPVTITPAPPTPPPPRRAVPPARRPEPVRRRPVADRPSVFVSHRSSDSAWFLHVVVDHLRRALRPHPVFADTALRAGQVWPERLDTELRRCAALVALIGPNWRSASAVLQYEIKTAIERNVLLLPVLFDGATMPSRSDLPAGIGALAERQAVQVDPAHLPDDLMRIELAVRGVL